MNRTNGVNATSTPIVAPRLAVPPPGPTLDLTDMDRRVGWVRGDVIGFRGFGSHLEAAHAAWAAHRAIVRRLDRRTTSGATASIDPEPLTLARSGGREVVLAGGRPIATLLRPGPESASGPDSFGFELRLGAPTSELTMRTAAHLAYRTLRRSGLPWAMWAPADRPEPSPAAEPASRRESRASVAPSSPTRRSWPSIGRALVRIAAVAFFFVLVAVAARPFAATQPLTVPIGVIAFAGLGAAAIAEANRRRQPQRLQSPDGARVADRWNDPLTSPRRAV